MNAKHLLFPLLLGSIPSLQANPFKPVPGGSSLLSFVENKGQVTDPYYQYRKDIDFRLNGNGVSVFVANAALHYQWVEPIGATGAGEDTLRQFATYRMDVKLLGADPHAVLVKEQKQDFYERYYLPQSGEQGRLACAYQKITYKDVYPNIDWVLYVKNNTMEYDFVVRTGGNVADIQLQYDGAIALKLNTDGSLTAKTPMGSITEAAPVSFQEDGKRIASAFVLKDNILRFTASEYKGILVIDPTLSWATYYGGATDETAERGCVTGDRYGNGYLCGYTFSTANIATSGSYSDTITGSSDAFLVKFNSAGARIWATYYGGAGADQGLATTCDMNGNVFLTGYASLASTGMATTGSHQPSGGGNQDAFLVKFDTAGARLWATYYGGTAAERGHAVTCDVSGNIFLAGYTNNSASGIATTGAHQGTGGGGNDAFLAKFNSAGVRQWGTYYGGNATDQAFSLACDHDKNLIMTGYTNNSLSGIASVGAYQTTGGGGQDAFVVKFDSTGARQWGSYFGGTGTEQGTGITCDRTGNSYITGHTTSSSAIATAGSHQPVFGGGITGVADAFIVKFNRMGALQWSTYYGNIGNDKGTAICSGLSNSIYVIGTTNSSSGMATPGGIKDTLDIGDTFLAKFDTSGTRQWGTYFGGTDGEDLGSGIFCNNVSQLFLGGVTTSITNMATAGSHQTVHNGGSILGYDAFLSLINDCDLIVPQSISGNDSVCRGVSYTYSVPPVAGVSSYTWVLPPGWTGSSATDTIHMIPGAITDTVKVVANYPCGSSDTLRKVIVVEPLPYITPSGTVSICSGDTALLTTVPGTAYQWLLSGAPISGAASQNYAVMAAGQYSVLVTNSHGCSDTSLTDTIIVHALPAPVITASGTVLSTGAYAGYQWNHNGAPIVGAVSSSYTVAIMSGLYTVTVTDGNGCKGTSDPYDANAAGLNEMQPGNRVYIYPNPATDLLHIRSSIPVDIHITGIDGRLIKAYRDAEIIDISHYEDGLYLLRIYANETLIGTKKLVKCNTSR